MLLQLHAEFEKKRFTLCCLFPLDSFSFVAVCLGSGFSESHFQPELTKKTKNLRLVSSFFSSQGGECLLKCERDCSKLNTEYSPSCSVMTSENTGETCCVVK